MDLPIHSVVIVHSYVSLPEGNTQMGTSAKQTYMCNISTWQHRDLRPEYGCVIWRVPREQSHPKNMKKHIIELDSKLWIKKTAFSATRPCQQSCFICHSSHPSLVLAPDPLSIQCQHSLDTDVQTSDLGTDGLWKFHGDLMVAFLFFPWIYV